MGRFNLLDESWITVMVNDKGNTKDVSITDLFANAHLYKRVAGDMTTQDFAVLRLLLAIMHTVFSRFNASGEQYDFVELDDQYKQISNVDEFDLNNYEDALYETWISLWVKGKFPSIVNEYLSKWHDHFYLFDTQYPFYQVTAEDVSAQKINKSAPSRISGKNINRLISESGNKASLFSPRFSSNSNKEILSAAEVSRWLLTFQGYSGLSDKVIFGNEKYKASKGWLFDIGGIIVQGSNLYETLCLNCVLLHPETKYRKYIQRPCWEYNSAEVINNHFSLSNLNNLAELYTNWSRAVYIDPQVDLKKSFEIQIVKVPEIDHQDQFLETMTLWRYNKSGDNKETFTPRKHQPNRSVWRSFGLLTMPNSLHANEEQRKPGLTEWLSQVREWSGSIGLTVQAISMQDDGNATSWVPVDEIADTLNINNYIFTDLIESGWIPRINEVVDLTKSVIDKTYWKFISDVKEIRNISNNASADFVKIKVEEVFFAVDQPFRNWLVDLKPDDAKDEKVGKWKETLKKIVLAEAQNFLSQAGPRDFIGIIKDEKLKNIATAYNSFRFFLDKQF